MPDKDSDRLSSENRKILVPKEKTEEPAKKLPPGILGRMPVKQVIRTTVSRERESANQSMPSDKSDSSSVNNVEIEVRTSFYPFKILIHS